MPRWVKIKTTAQQQSVPTSSRQRVFCTHFRCFFFQFALKFSPSFISKNFGFRPRSGAFLFSGCLLLLAFTGGTSESSSSDSELLLSSLGRPSSSSSSSSWKSQQSGGRTTHFFGFFTGKQNVSETMPFGENSHSAKFQADISNSFWNI